MGTTLVKPQPSKPSSTDSNSSSKRELISEWVVRFALNADKPLNAKEQAVYCSTWEEGFSDVDEGRLKAAFIACLRSHMFKTIPTIGDIRRHLQNAESNKAEEEAAQKFDEVLRYFREECHPDLKDRQPRKISERTRRAINAAGGARHLRECIGDDLVFARKRFIESYLRWNELEQGRFLLPEGEVTNLLAGVAKNMSVERLLEAPKVIEPKVQP